MTTQYSSFGRRFIAAIVDVVIFLLLFFIAALVAQDGFFSFFEREDGHLKMPFLLAFLYAFSMIYSATFTASKWQAIPGKKLLGIKIGDLNGNRISFFIACSRFFFKFLPIAVIILCDLAAYLWQSVAFTRIYFYVLPLLFLAQFFWPLPALLSRDKRSVYDAICNTRVFRKYPKTQGKILRAAGQLATAFILAISTVATIAVLINYWNQPLNKNLQSFLRDDADYVTEGNGFYAFFGLDAPRNTADIHAYGVNKYAGKKQYTEARTKELRDYYSFSPLSGFITILHDIDLFFGGYLKPEENVEFVGKASDLYCLHGNGVNNTQGNDQNAPKYCSPEKISRMMNDNALLIERYRSIYQYKKFSDGELRVYMNLDLIFAINELLNANMIMLARAGKAEQALDEWIENFRFLKIVNSGRYEFINKHSLMTPLGMSLRNLPVILNENPALLKSYKEKLQNVLTPLSPEFYNISALMRAQYDSYNAVYVISENMDQYNYLPQLFVKPDAARNKFYYFALDMLDLSKKPAAELVAEKEKISKKYSGLISLADLYNPIGGIFGNLQLMTVAEYITGFFIHIHKQDAYVRMLNLYLEIVTQKIPKDKIADFIASDANKNYRNPFTEKPFNYDEKGNRIFYSLPDEENVEYQVDLPEDYI